MRARIMLPISIVVMLLVASMSAVAVGAYHEGDNATHAFADPAFERTWERTDEPVAAGQTQRTWMWGPEPYTEGRMEPYENTPGGERLVQYFDKARMEINNPFAEDDGLWFVTTGRLVVEMMDGMIQVGDDAWELHSEGPSNENVAGDPGMNNGPTYATMGMVRDEPAAADGALLTQRLALDGTISNDPSMAAMGVTAAFLVEEWGANHQVASVFWDFMHTTDTVYVNGEFVEDQLFDSPFYMTGYPITEAYWTEVRVDGTPMDVLVQCFERRCLTYTPDNDPLWQVEAGNVGQHYYRWLETHTGRPDDGDDNDNGNGETGTFTATLTALDDSGVVGAVDFTVEDGIVGAVGMVTGLEADTEYELRIVSSSDCADFDGADFVSFTGTTDATGTLVILGAVETSLLSSELSSSVVVIYDAEADVALSCGAIVEDTGNGED